MMPNLMKLSDVAQACAVSTRTVRDWSRRGLIRTVRLPGGHLRVHVDEARRLTGGQPEM